MHNVLNLLQVIITISRHVERRQWLSVCRWLYIYGLQSKCYAGTYLAGYHASLSINHNLIQFQLHLLPELMATVKYSLMLGRLSCALITRVGEIMYHLESCFSAGMRLALVPKSYD